jgi:hypothetical protein
MVGLLDSRQQTALDRFRNVAKALSEFRFRRLPDGQNARVSPAQTARRAILPQRG